MYICMFFLRSFFGALASGSSASADHSAKALSSIWSSSRRKVSAQESQEGFRWPSIIPISVVRELCLQKRILQLQKLKQTPKYLYILLMFIQIHMQSVCSRK